MRWITCTTLRWAWLPLRLPALRLSLLFGCTSLACRLQGSPCACSFGLQFHAGGQEVFWEMLSNDNPLCVLGECTDGRSAIDRMLSALYTRGNSGGGSGSTSGHRPSGGTTTGSGLARPHIPHSSDPYPHPQYHRRNEEPPQRPPPLLSYMEFTEQQLQQNLAAATGPSQTDPFVAAFVASCLVGCASLYIYTHRKGLARLLALPGRLVGAGAGGRTDVSAGGGGGSGVTPQQLRHTATAALRDAMAVDNATRLAAAIEAAEAAGVQKLLVKKGRAALQSLRKRRHHGAGGAARARQGPSAGHAGHGAQASHSPAHGVERTVSSSSAGSMASSTLAPSLSVGAAKDGVDSAGPTPAGLTPLGSSSLSANGSVLGGSSFRGAGSLGRSISEGTASLLRAAEDARAGLLDGASEGGFLQPNRRGKPALRAAPAPLVTPAPRSETPPLTAAQQQLSSAGAPPYSHPLRSNDSDVSDDAAVAAALAAAAAEAQAAAAATTGDATPLKRPSSAACGGRGPFSPATPAESVPRSSPTDNHGSDGSSGSPPPSPCPAAPAAPGPSTVKARASGGSSACHATAAVAAAGKTVVQPPPPPPPRTKATIAVAPAMAASVAPAAKRNLVLPPAPAPGGGTARAAAPEAKDPAAAAAGKPAAKQAAQAKGGAAQVSPASERRPTVALVPRALLRRNQGQAAARVPSPSPSPSPAKPPASAAPPAAAAGSLSPPHHLVSDTSSQRSAGSSLPPSPTQLGAAASAASGAASFALQASLGSPLGQAASEGAPSVLAEGAAPSGAVGPSLGLGGWSRFAPPVLGAWEQQHESPRLETPGGPGLLGPHVRRLRACWRPLHALHRCVASQPLIAASPQSTLQFGDMAAGLRPPFPSPTTPFGAAPPPGRPSTAAGMLAGSEASGAVSDAAALLAQLHEIWGSGGGGSGGGAAAGGAPAQLYSQLVPQQAAAGQHAYRALGAAPRPGGGSLGGSAASSGDPPPRPRGADAGGASAATGLPPASSAMLREVLGSPLAGLPLLAGRHSRQLSAESVLSGSRRVAATLDLLPPSPLPPLEPDGGGGAAPPLLGPPADGADRGRGGPEQAGARPQDDSLDLAALGFTEGSSLALLELPPAARSSAELRCS